MTNQQLNELRKDLSVKAKNGVDFISAASLIWLGVTYIWMLPIGSYNRSVLTFILTGLMLPLAFAFSKVYKTQWKLPGNPLQPLGLWLNLAQLFYFPFLIFVIIRFPEYFLMTFAIITGAHFFPYAWFYVEKAYAVVAGIISVGAMLQGLVYTPDQMYLIALFTAAWLLMLALWLYRSAKGRSRSIS